MKRTALVLLIAGSLTIGGAVAQTILTPEQRIDALAAKRGQPGGIAALDGNGSLPISQLPPTFPVEAMTATATGASAGQTLGGWFSSIVLGTPTVTSLRAYSRFFIRPGTLITVGGYTAIGDGGGGTFRWSNTATATDDGVLTINPNGNGLAGRWLRIFNGTLPVEAAGALCNGGADDTAAFRRAVAALAGLGRGGTILTGPKACIVSGTIDGAPGVFFSGTGREVSAILTNAATGDVIRFGTASASYNNFGMSNLTVASTVTRTSGALISVAGSRGTLRSVGLRGGYDGLTVDNYGNQAILVVDDLLAEGMDNECISLGRDATGRSPTNQALFANGLHLTSSTLAQCKRSIAFYSASGIYLKNVESYQAGSVAYYVAPTTSHLGIQGVWADTVLADSGNGDGWLFAGSGKIAEVWIAKGQASSNNGHGLEVAAGTNLNGLSLTDFMGTVNTQHGMRIAGGTNIAIRGGQFWDNGTSGGGIGIAFESGVNGFSITGVMSGCGGWAALTNITCKQSYGVYIAGPSNNNYAITGNQFVGNTSGGLNDGGTGTNKIVGNNLAY